MLKLLSSSRFAPRFRVLSLSSREPQLRRYSDRKRTVGLYASSDRLLIVGDGDLSFSASLAGQFTLAPHLIATTLHTEAQLIQMFRHAVMRHLAILRGSGAMFLGGVDCTRMMSHPVLSHHRFDHIIYNFPHAGVHPARIKPHQELLLGFFSQAIHLVDDDGEIHVSHHTRPPYETWQVERLATSSGLQLIAREVFDPVLYPGYRSRVSSGHQPDRPFILRDGFTSRFRKVA